MTDLTHSRQVLEETPARAAKFLQGVGAVPVIRSLLSQAGMGTSDLEEGRSKLLACLAEPVVAVELDTPEARAQRGATAELNQWDEPNFARHGATLRRHFPSAHAYVFQDLSASDTGDGAIKGVATFLLRLDALEQGTDAARSASREQDTRAVALLEQRSLTKAERLRLRALVDVALGPTKPLSPLPSRDDSSELRMRRLAELRDWYNEWASIARAVVKKRSYLIRLGLAARRLGQIAEDGTEVEAGGVEDAK
jgi:hypothetical protein